MLFSVAIVKALFSSDMSAFLSKNIDGVCCGGEGLSGGLAFKHPNLQRNNFREG